MKSINIYDENFNIINKQINLQKKGIILFPFVILFFIILSINDYHGKELIFILVLFILYTSFLFVYSPIKKGILLGKIFYSVNILKGSTIEFTAYATLWRSEKIIIADLKDIKVDKTPLPRLLYKKYELNAIFIEGEKYYIFNKLLVESEIAN